MSDFGKEVAFPIEHLSVTSSPHFAPNKPNLALSTNSCGS